MMKNESVTEYDEASELTNFLESCIMC